VRTRLRSRVIGAVAAGVLCASFGAHTAGAQDHPGGCQAFGANVAGLAQALGADFGATASGVASSSAAAFPTQVVKPEQDAFC
jgi:hypothetical protein